MKAATEKDYSSLLDTPPDRLKGLLGQRAQALAKIDKAIQTIREMVQDEGLIRGQIRDALEPGGWPMKDAKIQLLSGVDIVDRVFKQLAVGNVLGGDRRDDKTVPAATCSQLADYHPQIQELFEKALAGEVPREKFVLPERLLNGRRAEGEAA